MYGLKQAEIEQCRTPKELNKWVEETLAKLQTDEGVRAIRLKSTDEIKVFMEESHPLNVLSRNLFFNRNDISLSQVVGSQSYDVEVKGFESFDYIEITYVTDKEEYHRMMILDEEGSVSTIAPVIKRKGAGKVKSASELVCEPVAMEHNSIIAKSRGMILKAFNKKKAKSHRYPPRTHLVIAFDDSHYFLDKDRSFIEETFNNDIVPQKADFISVSLVGLNKNTFFTSIKAIDI